jgi:hypothetical protein
MPIRKEEYPHNWDEISQHVRQQAGQRCERCGAPNGAVIQRRSFQHVVAPPELAGYDVDWCRIESVTNPNGQQEPTQVMTWARLRMYSLVRIVLTVAHLDQDPGNNTRANLSALCQRCHFAHDRAHNLSNRRYGRDHARSEQLKLV